jgi:hypothetical protein
VTPLQRAVLFHSRGALQNWGSHLGAHKRARRWKKHRLHRVTRSECHTCAKCEYRVVKLAVLAGAAFR